jgi:Tfp pilus assembly protein PilF
MQPSYAASLCNYGRLLQKRQHDLDLAGDMMAKAVRLHPEQPALMSNYALFLEDGVRDPMRAQEVYERALQLHPSDTVPFCSLFHMASWHSSFELQT